MKRTSKKQIRELEEMARETIDEGAMLYARYEKDATGNAYALINGRTYIYKSNSAMYDAVADMVLYPDETAAAQDEAEKAITEACKAIEAAASGDAAAIAEHYGAAEEHADNARNHARKAHTYAADEAARNAANAVIEAEMAITEKAHDIAEALADEANATNAQRAHATSAAFAELTAQPWTATAEDREAVDAMVQAIAEQAETEAAFKAFEANRAEHIAEQLKKYANMPYLEFDAAVQLMDDDIREELHASMTPCSPAEFLAAYEAAHLAKYGAPFQYV